MSQPGDRAVHTKIPAPDWRILYRIAGAAALIAVIVFRRNMGTELVTFRGFGILDVPEVFPSTAPGWFTLLQENRLVGLALLDVVDLINYALLGLIFLALYGTLRRANKGATVIAAVCGLIGIAVYFISNQAFSMLSLSEQYAAAAAKTQRAMLWAAGEALLAIHRGTGIYLSLLLVTLAALVFSLVMLRSNVFGRATALVGIVASVSQLGYFVALPFAPAILALPFVISAPFRITWYVLVALKLFRLAADTPAAAG